MDPLTAPVGSLFVGRDRELELLDAQRGMARLVTLTGPGGVGKSRLARHAAHRWSVQLDVWFCELGAARTLGEVEHALGVTAGVVPEQLIDVLARRGPTLLVLDNVGRAVPSLVPWIERCLAATTETWLLVTSREPLFHPAEVRCDVRPLPLDEGVALFLARATAVRADFTAAADTVRELVRRLDGLPLAIELAAARTAAFSVPQLLERISRDLGALRSLRQMIDEAWQTLSPIERAALAQCAVFCNGFDLADAEHVVDLAEVEPLARVDEVLERLAARSFLRVDDLPDGSRRLSLLETVRMFVREQGGDTAAVQRRHAQRFVGQARRWRRDGATHLARIEFANLVAAFEASEPVDAAAAVELGLALDRVLADDGPRQMHREILERTRAAAERAGSATQRSEVELALAECLLLSGAAVEARGAAERARELAVVAGDAELTGRVLASLGRAVRDAGGDPVPTWRAAVSALGDGGPDTPHAGKRAELLTELGYHTGDLDLVTAALLLAERARDPRRRTFALCHLAVLEAELGRRSEARAHAHEVLAIARAIPDPRIRSPLLTHGASALLLAGEREVALRALLDALDIDGATGNEWNELMTRSLIWLMDAGESEGDAAIARARERIFKGRWTPAYHALMTAHFAVAVARAGSRDETREATRQALELGRDPNDRRAIACICAIAEVLLVRTTGDDPAAAMREARARLAEIATLDRLQIRASGRAVEWLLAAECLARLVDAAPASSATAADDPAALVIGPHCGWFAIDGARVDLSARPVLRALLALLVERRVSSGVAIETSELTAGLWPDERARAGLPNRLYNAISQLRALGLRDVLLRRGDGYLLDPAKVLRTKSA